MCEIEGESIAIHKNWRLSAVESAGKMPLFLPEDAWIVSQE
jgi:hypothetical protein